MNKLFQETQQNNVMNKLQQFMQNIPKEYQGSPKSAVDYLVQSGKVSQDALNKAMQTAQRMGIKL